MNTSQAGILEAGPCLAAMFASGLLSAAQGSSVAASDLELIVTWLLHEHRFISILVDAAPRRMSPFPFYIRKLAVQMLVMAESTLKILHVCYFMLILVRPAFSLPFR